MHPLDEIKAPFVFEIDIPTREQVVAVAKEKHGLREPWAGKTGEWMAVYIPPRNWTSTDVDPYAGQAISEPKPGGIIVALFCVGIKSFWHAEVLFQNEEGTYYESQQIQSQATGFFLQRKSL